MSNYNDNRARPRRDSRTWAWVAGLVALVAVVGVIYGMSDNGGTDTASNPGGTASTAPAPGNTGAGTPAPGTTR